MFKVQVPKKDLLEVLHKNRDGHRDVFLKAQEKFRQRAIQEFEARLERARKGDAIDLYVRLPVPEEHTDDYDRAIAMLAMSVDDNIELNEQEFAQYVQDEWGWKQAWATSTGSYLAQ